MEMPGGKGGKLSFTVYFMANSKKGKKISKMHFEAKLLDYTVIKYLKILNLG